MTTERHPAAGAFAGAVGGFVAGLVKLGCEVVVPPRLPGRFAPPDVLIANITHAAAPQAASLAIHFTFSIVSGAVYGALVELFPIVGVGMGTAFGLAVWAGAHEIVMPAIGLTPPLTELPASEQINEALTHGLWGWTVEIVRSDLRRRYAPRPGA